ncbi:MAG TPA: glycoside hydrolase family 2 TIM barrel-domain containing protein [Verrucomicrobiae bacterium]|nr:glycoside hydrolase family 2 TIM barrel-domain containing protein [Verrucomicrobiae bacterium]
MNCLPFACCRFAAILLFLIVSIPASAASRETISFDSNWRFFQGNATGAEAIQFNDSAWRVVNVPHDWSIEGPFAETNTTRGSGAFLPSGIAWYRKSFSLNSSAIGRSTWIEFDGVMANSDVWINGQHLGHRPNGYVSFHYDLTPFLNPSDTNVISVRADTSQQPASRWYTGAGIYRHVRLVVTDPVHLAPWGVFVTTPNAGADAATVRVQATVTNASTTTREVKVQITIRDAKGKSVASSETASQSVAAGATANFSAEVSLKNPQRWSLEQPVLYSAVTKVISENSVVDDVVTPFGIREFEFKADTGFWLNGKNFKIKGVAVHHDGGAFGAAVPLRIWERRLQTLKELGVNAIRTAHNPVAPEFLDLCDRMGLLVMDEFFDCWTVGKNRYDYHLYFDDWSKIDERDTILRDRNHPSIVLYSVGNEIHDTPKQELAKRILAGLVEVAHENDPTRPVTQALFRPNVSGDYTNGLADLLDVIGTNYRDQELLDAHRANPNRKIIGTEQGHELKTWLACRDHPEHAGQFLWTGIDYLGEARRWPRIGFGSGLLDRTGMPRPVAFQRQSWWSEKPMVAIARRVGADELAPTDPGYESADLRRPQVLFMDWTPRKTEPHEENVEVYSNCEEVELLLNGKSLGIKSKPADDSARSWKVPYAPGILKAIGRNNRKIAATQELSTAGAPAKILLSADRNQLTPAWDDVCTVNVSVVDQNGVLIPNASDLIEFRIEGPAVIAAVDNGDNASHEPFQAMERRAYQGRCIAMIKANAEHGRITLTASAAGLKTASLSIQAAAEKRTNF